jgi:hypothetical protein
MTCPADFIDVPDAGKASACSAAVCVILLSFFPR